jgi:histidinol-phosphatase (PHP family)
VLPADSHVHSEWSWDAMDGSMEGTCARALEIGLPAVAFTEHTDFTTWTMIAEELDERLQHLVTTDGKLTPPQMDVAGYQESLQRCRERFPGLHIISGVELGEAHWHKDLATRFLEAGQFDRVLGSLHSLPHGQQFLEMPPLYLQRPAAHVMRDYLAEVARLVAGSDLFSVLAHIDYPVRYWPADAGPFDPSAFEDDFRHALRTLADSGRALEVNTVVPLDARVVRWWREEGGESVTFGSDAHEPIVLGRGFAEASAMVEAQGFRPARHPYDVWSRVQ